MNFFGDMKKIYHHLEDDISKKLFLARVNFSITGDWNYITQLSAQDRNLDADTEAFAQTIFTGNYKKRTVFGAGANGQNIALALRNFNIFAFIDNYRKEKEDERTGLPVFSLEEYIRENGVDDTQFIVAVNRRDWAREMLRQLLENGVERTHIAVAVADWRNNCSQYFDLFTPREHEAFVDCGCYDGSTAFRFAGWCGTPGYDRIWCFEPDPKSFETCRRLLNRLQDCELYPYGLSDSSRTVSFASSGKENARIVKAGMTVSGADLQTIQTVALDDILKGERVTFIKMDIEGAEYDALAGASHLIKEQKPRLAISIYHNLNHIISIPKLLLTLRPDYRLRIRHYSLLPNETILYAE